MLMMWVYLSDAGVGCGTCYASAPLPNRTCPWAIHRNASLAQLQNLKKKKRHLTWWFVDYLEMLKNAEQ